MTFLVDHPEKHKQSTLACETGACVAGHGVLLNGYRVVVPFDGIVAEKGTDAEIRDITQGFEDCGMKGWATQPYYDRIIRAGAVHVREAAMRVFGIDQLDTDSTFWALP